MLIVMTALGIAPVFALTAVPVRVGGVKATMLTGEEARREAEARMAANPTRLAAFKKAASALEEKGKTLSGVVVSHRAREVVQQSFLRRLGEAIVPTLHAAGRAYDDEGMAWWDYSGYDPSFVGLIDVYSGWDGREAMLQIEFSKDPSTSFATASSEVVYYSGFEPEPSATSAPGGVVGRITHAVRQAVYPSLNANELSKSWWDRLNDWASCTVVGCSTSASACWIANVLDAEMLWAPCFTAWCGGTEVGCAVYAIIH